MKSVELLFFVMLIRHGTTRVSGDREYCLDRNRGLSAEFVAGNSVDTGFIRKCVYMCLVRCNKMKACDTVVFSNTDSSCKFYKTANISDFVNDSVTDVYVPGLLNSSSLIIVNTSSVKSTGSAVTQRLSTPQASSTQAITSTATSTTTSTTSTSTATTTSTTTCLLCELCEFNLFDKFDDDTQYNLQFYQQLLFELPLGFQQIRHNLLEPVVYDEFESVCPFVA
jgi:hypothetical protein